jgi:hypothetical protein
LKILRVCGIEGKLLGFEVAETYMPCLQVHEQRRETLEVRGVRIRDDVEIPGRADDAMRVKREAADDDVLHSGFVQRPKQWLRVERLRHALRVRLNASANRFANSV